MTHSRLFHLKANPSQRRSILVVDDNVLNRNLIIPALIRIFKKENITIDVEQAEDGIQAVNKVEERIKLLDKDYDIIVMDRDMPNLDGIEATHRIKDLEASHQLADAVRSLVIAWSANEVKVPYGDAELDKPLKCSQMTNLFRSQGYFPEVSSTPALSA